jgi:hypothetical protein
MREISFLIFLILLDFILISIHVFLLQGAFMGHRLENESEVKDLVERIFNILAKTPPASFHPH